MNQLKKPLWKKKKRRSYYFYFTFFVSIIICGAVSISILISKYTDEFVVSVLGIPKFIVLVISSLIIGGVFSYFVGKFAFSPIKKIRNAMNEVSEGNLDISVKEEHLFNEIEDINHAFNIMVKELRSTEIIQSDFISNVSHEFKTPLTSIEGYATMLEDGNLSEEEREYVKKILFNAHRMSELVNNILLLSKLDHQGIEDFKEEFSVDEQIRQEILATEIKWSEKKIEFDIDLDSVTFYGNIGLISHIWSNLLGNAIKFSPYGGTIKMTLKTENDGIVFCISDEGEGVKEDVKNYIFDRFYQVDTSHKQEGNGLGLALVKKIVDIYGGEVAVDNLQPKGCVFTVRLPKR